MGNAPKIRIRQHGQILKAFAGCRFHRGGVFAGIIGRTMCYSDVVIGDAHDGRRGKSLTSEYFDGPVTIEILDAAGNVAGYVGLATSEQVASHPNCRASLR